MGTSLNGKIQCVIKKNMKITYIKEIQKVFFTDFLQCVSLICKINTKNNKCILM